MVKRFASNYVFIPSVGFIKKAIIELDNNGTIKQIQPLIHETSNTVWLPGVIVILDGENNIRQNYNIFNCKSIINPEDISSLNEKLQTLVDYRLIHVQPFNFEAMAPDEHATYQLI